MQDAGYEGWRSDPPGRYLQEAVKTIVQKGEDVEVR